MANPAVLIFSSDDRAAGHREATLRPRELIRLHSMDAEGLHGRRIETNPPCYALMVTKGHGLDDTPLPSRSPWFSWIFEPVARNRRCISRCNGTFGTDRQGMAAAWETFVEWIVRPMEERRFKINSILSNFCRITRRNLNFYFVYSWDWLWRSIVGRFGVIVHAHIHMRFTTFSLSLYSTLWSEFNDLRGTLMALRCSWKR